ncbi:MAG: amidohydrolase family protein [Ardenticatenaceae bacterium]|nr:amidohydrolase family protein [Ardenticatenaceae bacterium]
MTTTLIHNGTIIDGHGGTPIDQGAVLIRDNQIVQVGRKAEIRLPSETIAMVDAQGGTVLPGLIDTHVHIMFEDFDIRNMMATPLSLRFYKALDMMRRTVDAGITTVRDAGGADMGVKMAIEQGEIVGPRLQISVTALSITGGHGDGLTPSGMRLDILPHYPGMPYNICDGVDGVRKKVREVLQAGAEVIKICSTGGVLSPADHPEFTQFSMAELEAIVEEARFRRGIKVMSHAQGTEGVKNAILAGVHSIEHGIYLDEEVLELMLERGTFLVPTLLAPVAVLEIAREKGTMPEYGVRKAAEVIEIHSESIAAAFKAGVKIAMGTDAGVFPHGQNLRELQLMCGVGMSPMDSIVATTKVAAECLGWEDRIGTLTAGKLADVIITAKDPLTDIATLKNPQNIKLVMKDGQILKDNL